MGGLEDAEVDVVFCGGEGEDELLGGSAALSCSGSGATSCAGQRRVVLDPTTYLFPSELCNVFQVDATCETNRAVGCAVEDEREEIRQKAGLGRELVLLLLRLFSRRWLQRHTEQRGEWSLQRVSLLRDPLWRFVCH